LIKENVEYFARARGLTFEELGQRLGLDPSQLTEALSDERPRAATVGKVASELVVPRFWLFSERPPHISELPPDFRFGRERKVSYSKQTIKAVQFARDIARNSASLRQFLNFRSFRESYELRPSNVVATANKMREDFELHDEVQVKFRDAAAFYKFLRKKTEERGVFVFHASFPTKDGTGFCIVGDDQQLDSITINTKNQSSERRCFTLIHEIAHIILGTSAVVDPFRTSVGTEQLCERFAAAFLAPKNLVDYWAAKLRIEREFDLSKIRELSRKLKVSMHVCVLRLLKLKWLDDSARAAWYAYIKSFPDYDVTQSAPPRVEEWRYKLARYGFLFATVYRKALESDLLDEFDVSRLSGIRYEYVRPYLINAALARAEDAEDALDD
jgi:Zn-dependent peptidase ImmA (M78 family)